MKAKTIVILLSIACFASVSGQNAKKSVYDEIWSKVVWYENEENDVLHKLAFTGRLQGDYHSFDDDVGRTSESDYDWRRFRVGLKASLFNRLTLHSEADMNLNDPSPLYKKLTDTYLLWTTGGGVRIKVGKQSAPFTLHGSTSSKKLYTLERGKVASNIWFSNEYYSGLSFSGTKNNWEYFTGIYSSDLGSEFDEAFDYGSFGVFSVGYNFKENLELDNALVRIDYVKQQEDSTNPSKQPDHKNVTSLVAKFEKDNLHLWTDLSFSDGYGSQNDLFGLQLMPFYDITDKTQAVFSYTYLQSSGGDAIKLTRYEKDLFSGKGTKLSESFLGLNHFFYGHKLKWQNAIQYSEMDTTTSGDNYDGWGFTSGLRISW
jgi:phosphate-selective porin OprO and OprP